jgi:hypothetical protein
MGMAKNTGKTVALNHLLAQAAADDVAVGLTSIGRDGEERDAVFNFPKPPVSVWPGTVVATARSTLQRARVRHKLIDATGIQSPMGEIVLVKVLEAGDMEVAGASRSHDQQRVIALLRQCGAQISFLDGALGRSQHASPALADGVVLATGAALGGSVADVLRKTREKLALLGVPQADAATSARCAGLFDGTGVACGAGRMNRCSARPSPRSTPAPLLAQLQTPMPNAGITTVACTGAVGRALWRAFRNPGHPPPRPDGGGGRRHAPVHRPRRPGRPGSPRRPPGGAAPHPHRRHHTQPLFAPGRPLSTRPPSPPPHARRGRSTW